MATARTWLFIILGVIGVILLGFAGCVGAGYYFITHHVSTTHTTNAAAVERFEAARAPFKGQTPLIRADLLGGGVEVKVEDLPTSTVKPAQMHIMAWDPKDDGQLVQISLPFWLLKLGKRKMNFGSPQVDMDLQRMNLDAYELERIGPRLVLDAARPDGTRVLIWTK